MISSFISFLFSIRKKILYLGVSFLIFAFIYNYISIFIDASVYHAVMSPVFLTGLIGWTSSQIYALLIVLLFPETIKIIKKIISKL